MHTDSESISGQRADAAHCIKLRNSKANPALLKSVPIRVHPWLFFCLNKPA
jgi:hypothetical protein